MDINKISTLVDVPPAVLANETLRFNLEEIQGLVAAIREGNFDHADKHPEERGRIERVLCHSIRKSVGDGIHGLKSFIELQGLTIVLYEKYQRTGNIMDLNTAIFVLESCLSLDTERPLFGLLRLLFERHSQSQSPEDLERVIKSLQRVAGLVKDNIITKPAILYNLAGYLTMRYDSAGAKEDLSRAIEVGEHAICLPHDPDVIKPKVFNNLQAAFHRRFKHSWNMEDLNSAIAYGNRGMTLVKDEDYVKRTLLSNLVECFHSRYNLTGTTEDLQQAGLALQEFIAFIPDEDVDKVTKLGKLGRIFYVLYTMSGSLEDVDRAIENGKQAVSLAADVHSSKPQWLITLGRSFFLRFKLTGLMDDLDQAIERTVEAVTLVPNGKPINREWFHYLGSYFRTRYQHTREASDSVQAIENEQRAASEIYDDKEEEEVHPDYPLGQPLISSILLTVTKNISTCCVGENSKLEENKSVKLGLGDDVVWSFSQDTLSALQQLSFALHGRFAQNRDISDLEMSISLSRQALSLTPQSHPDLSITLCNLAIMLYTQFEQKKDLRDLDESISFHKQALDLIPHPHPTSLNTLFSALSIQFNQKGAPGDLEEIIRIYRQALDLTPVPEPHQLFNLAIMLHKQFEERSNLGDLEESIRLFRQVIIMTPVPHSLWVSSLNNISAALYTRSEQRGDSGDLEESISFSRQALDSTSGPQSSLLINIAAALWRQFQQKGDVRDLEESIGFFRQALDLTPDLHPDRFKLLNNFANALKTQFEHYGDLEALEEVTRIHRQTLDLIPHLHPDQPTLLTNIASALSTQFERKGDFGNLEESIRFYRQALGLITATHHHLPTLLSGLAYALSTKFMWKKDFEDLEESLRFSRQALDLTPHPHPGRFISLNILAFVLSTQFEQGGDLGDWEESIRLYRQALDLGPVPHFLQASLLNNIASVLSKQSAQEGNLEESIRFCKQALELTPTSHYHQSTLLNNLAHALSTRFKQKGDSEDLEESIAFYMQSLDLTPNPHPDRATALNNLANALWTRFMQKGDLGDLEECVNLYREAVDYEFAPVHQRLQISSLWTYLADSHQHPSALEAYKSAINLLPHLASFDMNLPQRQEALLKAGGLASAAANCAIQNNQMKLAVEFLSTGRSIFWTQALHLRTPLDDLASAYPNLAQRLRSVSDTLESASMKFHLDTKSLTSWQKMDNEDWFSQLRKLKDEWIHTLGEVRQKEGFEHFLKPVPFSTLCLCASNGPVVLINAARLGCDALIVTLDGVKHVSLLNMDISKAVYLAMQVQKMFLQNFAQHNELASTTKIISSHIKEHRGPYYGQTSEKTLQSVLKTLWDFVVFPVITEMQLQKSESPGRIWWCPTGPFVFLPIHAAGVYDYGETECISDYCIPSYSSNLQDLLIPTASTCPEFRMLAVIQPQSLPGTIQELRRIEHHAPQPHEQYLVKLGDRLPATVAGVLDHLPSSTVVHFGCHGFQNPNNPLDSSLQLEDGHLKISEIIKCHTQRASLAYLSACETATGDFNSPDEAMHIAATMIFAGFHGVVGTMWEIADEDAPEVADIFYRHLFRHGPHPDLTEAARALHLAVKELRANNENISFCRWVPFVHYGV